MVVGLVDTSVLVDLLRGYEGSVSWFNSLTEPLGITRYVWLEILYGINALVDDEPKSKQKLRLATELLGYFDLIDATTQDLEWATKKCPKCGSPTILNHLIF